MFSRSSVSAASSRGNATRAIRERWVAALRAVACALALAGAAAGCGTPTQPSRPVAPLVPRAVAGYVNAAAYLPLHPAAAQLQVVDRQIELLRRKASNLPVSRSLPSRPMSLSTPRPPDSA